MRERVPVVPWHSRLIVLYFLHERKDCLLKDNHHLFPNLESFAVKLHLNISVVPNGPGKVSSSSEPKTLGNMISQKKSLWY